MLGQHANAQSTPPAQGQKVLDDIAKVVFEEAKRRVIKEYYDRVPGAKATNEQDEDKDKSKSAKKNKGKDKDKSAKGKGRDNGLPPGLAKRDQLPLGLAKRGNRLPSGLMKSDLPPELEASLPKLPNNVEGVVVDTDVLLVQKGTDPIFDVIEGIITGK
ncbi:hypothetical protein N8000_03185 [Rhodospirillales bacterium]|nr:hypothetical protein [Rhodospirillales bacterium]